MDICKESNGDEGRVQINNLPEEILEFIFTYLPPYKDLESCNIVCKRWNAIVKNYIRRAKINLHNGFLDFRLRWELLTEQGPSGAQSSILTSNQITHGNAITSPSSASATVQPTIAGRFSHSSVRHSNSMYVFGGGSSSDTTFNDLWRFDLSESRWERPLSMGAYPSPKGSASMVCWGDILVLFGGWRYPSLHPPYQPWRLFDELHYYDLKNNRWSLQNAPGPPPIAGHSASVHGDRMVIFGGYQIIDGIHSNSNELWCLDLKDSKWWQPRLVGNTKPPPRYGQFQLEIDENHLLIVGGCGGPNCVYSDAWLLDMSSEIWSWQAMQVRNKKYAASHMWCNPACKVGSKLIVLGSTPNMPQDFQMMKQAPIGRAMNAAQMGALHQNRNNLRHGGQGMMGGADGGPMALRPHPNQYHPDNLRLGGGNAHGRDDQYYANRRAILNQHQVNANVSTFNNNHLQPRTGRLSDLHSTSSPALSEAGPSSSSSEERNLNRPSTSLSAPTLPRLNGGLRNDNDASSTGNSNSNNISDMEAAARLQRNLALRCRDNNPLLPKRFDEMYEDPFRMAAFNVQSRPRSLSRDHNERIRRLEEKMNAIRNSRRNAIQEQKPVKEPSPKRVKRNVISLFVCDLSMVLDPTDPHIQWLEYKNYGILPGAPERLILSTIVPGNGELILFGGVQKSTLNEITHQVSNAIHILSAPRDIV